MRTPHFKLVRDRIPEILQAKGVDADFASIDDPEHRRAFLLQKLDEEILEYRGIAGICQPDVRELPCLFEIVLALGAIDGYSEEQISAQAAAKREDRGGFEAGIMLLTTEVEE